jgi:hypothetical protein
MISKLVYTPSTKGYLTDRPLEIKYAVQFPPTPRAPSTPALHRNAILHKKS